MDIYYVMMNIKNIVISTGMTLLFGVYSIYNILGYLNNMNCLYNYKLLEIQKNLDETYKKCINLQIDFVKIKEELKILSNKYFTIENRLTDHPQFYFSPNYDYYESSEQDKKSNEPICDEKCDLNSSMSIPKVKLETMNSIIENNFEDNNIINNLNEVFDEKLDYDCVEILNITDINILNVSPCSSKKNSLTNSEKNSSSIRSRSSSISDINWSGLTKKILFGL